MKWYLNRTLINTTAGAAGNLDGPCASEEEGDSYFPDLCLDGVRRHKQQFRQYSEFFRDAKQGTLPHFSMILPNSSYGDHPCNDVRKGERLQKDMYEALRAGKMWNSTLFLIVCKLIAVIFLRS